MLFGSVVYTLPGQSLQRMRGRNITLAPSGAAEPGVGGSGGRTMASVVAEMR